MAVRFFKCFIALFLFHGTVVAQPLRQFMNSGDDAFKRGDYYNAAHYYSQGLEKFEGNLELKFKYAEASRMVNDYAVANEFYKQVSLEDEKHQFPVAVFWLATMQKLLGKYDYAIVQFRKFKMHASTSDPYAEKAAREMESCKWAREHLKDSVRYTIVHLEQNANTEYTEFNPIENEDRQLQFSSLRNIADSGKSAVFLARLYEGDQKVRMLPIEKESDKHIANAAYSNTFDRMFFTECVNDADNSNQLRCEIYSSKKNNGIWQSPEKLNTNINAPGYTATQPDYVVKKNGDRVLYFVSDRPGGEGRKDVWYSIEKNNVFETPINAGKQINTPDDEWSPFYDATDSRLYFSSEGHYGFGGLDIFYSDEIQNNFTSATNLGAAVNSSVNDFDFFISTDRSKIYFSSNRKGSFFLKSETCCNDIWMFPTGKKPEPPLIVATPPPSASDSVVPQKSDSITPPVPVIAVSVPPLADSTYFDLRLKKMRQLLPVTLYFHNDEPECCNLRDTTALNYVTTYQEYWKRLNEYKSEFSKGLQQNEKTTAEQAIFSLFTNRVEKGYYDLIRFSRLLWEVLEAGGKVQLNIQGYCSPLNYNAYNIQLGYRRVASLRNYIYQYRNGLFRPFISNGQLIMKNESFGEETASKEVSDQREDTRNSVYNPEAAKERKVQIISVELKGRE
ncbi:MAG: hypothetical protein U0T73_13220 [Chitinophagales bacterium]